MMKYYSPSTNQTATIDDTKPKINNTVWVFIDGADESVQMNWHDFIHRFYEMIR